ncbi:MAG: hypothetical protein NT080_10160 [Spirochaetes bacterium]|nr:hypothetical protein [Spirochaetota bacterium]
MIDAKRFFLALAASACILPGSGAALFGQAEPRTEGFSAVGNAYLGTASAVADGDAAAVSAAKTKAVWLIMEGLGKDGLFAELFLANPPITIEFKVNGIIPAGNRRKASVTVTIDDESLRIIHDGIYLSTASNLLDRAETDLAQSQELAGKAKSAEAERELGDAVVLYWQAVDLADSAVRLVSPIGDASIFSTTYKKKAPEIRLLAAAVNETARAGLERIQEASGSLAIEEDTRAALGILDEVTADISKVEDFLRGIEPSIIRVSSLDPAELKLLRDRIDSSRRLLADSKVVLDRNCPGIPAERKQARAGYEVAYGRIRKYGADLRSAWEAVDLEIRDPAVLRAERERNLRWILLHEPTGALAFTVESPFTLELGGELPSFAWNGLMDFTFSAEGCFPLGSGHAWARTAFRKDDVPLCSSGGSDTVVNMGLSQDAAIGLDFGLLWGLGLSWDWARFVDGIPTSARMLKSTLYLGDVNPESGRTDWLVGLSYILPSEEIPTWHDAVNLGLDLRLLLGASVELDGSLSYRALEAEYGFDKEFAASIGAGFRLPPPFIWGIEYDFRLATRLSDSGDTLEEFGSTHSGFRFIFGYSL